MSPEASRIADAAYILPDADPEGEPTVPNGIALRKLHHAAFDHFLLSVRPDYTFEIRQDVLQETDGPMLKHGLQGMHGPRMQLSDPKALRPSPDLLTQRHRQFHERCRVAGHQRVFACEPLWISRSTGGRSQMQRVACDV